jgi:hypothetical protein
MFDRILEMKREGLLDFAKLFLSASTEEIAFHARLKKGEYSGPLKGYWKDTKSEIQRKRASVIWLRS